MTQIHVDEWNALPPRERWLEQVQSDLVAAGFVAEPALLNSEVFAYAAPMLVAARQQGETWDDTAVRVATEVAAALLAYPQSLIESVSGESDDSDDSDHELDSDSDVDGSGEGNGQEHLTVLVEWSTVGAVISALAEILGTAAAPTGPDTQAAWHLTTVLHFWSEELVSENRGVGSRLPLAAAVAPGLVFSTHELLTDTYGEDTLPDSLALVRARAWLSRVADEVHHWAHPDPNDTDDDEELSLRLDSYQASDPGHLLALQLGATTADGDEAVEALTRAGHATLAVLPAPVDDPSSAGVVALHVNPGETLDHAPCQNVKLCPLCDADLLYHLLQDPPVVLKLNPRGTMTQVHVQATMERVGNPEDVVAEAAQVAWRSHSPQD